MAAPSGFSARQRFSLFARYVTLERQNAMLAQICCYCARAGCGRSCCTCQPGSAPHVYARPDRA